MNDRRTRPGIFGPLILITLGVIFLLDNLDRIDWSVWDVILRFWPVLLIAAGLDLILSRRSAWGSAIALILVLVVVGGGLAVIGEPPDRSTETQPVAIPLSGARRAEVILDPSVGHLRLIPESAGKTDLLSGRLTILPGERIDQDWAVSGSTLKATVMTESWAVMPFITLNFGRPSWDLALHPGLPVDLDVDLGMGRTDLNLRGLQVGEARVHTGMGEAVVVLPDADAEVRIDVGIGAINVELPPEAGVRIRVERGIGSSSVPSNFAVVNGAYLSPGYEQAVRHIDLFLDIGIGAVNVR